MSRILPRKKDLQEKIHLMAHTDTQTERHRNLKTESFDSVKIMNTETTKKYPQVMDLSQD